MNNKTMKFNDLKQIKSKYGEKMSYFCRDNFGIILENDGMLFDILSENFDYNKSLFADIASENKEQDFKNFIFEIYYETNKNEVLKEQDAISQSPFELMKRVGYTLTKCETNEDVLLFKKYWHKNEELCTFRDSNRINDNLIFFAIKDNIDAIKREDFKCPERQDTYGVSAISIQFNKCNGYLSIKNRYNHAVKNCDATFGNNLDNIIEGLSGAFKDMYSIKIVLDRTINRFELENYIQCNKWKFYKYNHEINNTYFCKNNITISNGIVTEYDKSRYDLVDYFLVDKKEKNIKTLITSTLITSRDSFVEYFDKNIAKIEVNKNELNRKFNITSLNGKECYFIVNENNEMIEYNNPHLEVVGNYFLYHNRAMTILKLDGLKIVGDCFFYRNRSMTALELNSLEIVGDDFFFCNQVIITLKLNSLETVRDNFFYNNRVMTTLKLNNLKTVKNDFFYRNNAMTTLKLDSLKAVGNKFFYSNQVMTILELNGLEEAGSGFLFNNEVMTTLKLNSLKRVDSDFCYSNKAMVTLGLNSLKGVGNGLFSTVGNGFFFFGTTV